MPDFQYKIGRVKIENVKGIIDVEIDPSKFGDVICIGGQNAVGKSSVLDAILYPIAGRRVDAARVIRNGADRAEVSIELDGRDGARRRKYIVCRKWVRVAGGDEIKSTVTVKIVFGPGESTSMARTANVDSPATFLNDLSGRIGIVDPHDFIRDFGTKELSQLVDAFAPGESIATIDDALDKATDDRRDVRDRVRLLISNRDAFSVAIEYLQNRRDAFEKEIVSAAADADALNVLVGKLRSDRVALLTQIRDVVPGLSIDEDRLFFNGSALRDCSAAEQIRIGALLSVAVDPDLRVLLIRDGSLMDDESLQILRDLAINNGFQIWVEIVGAGADITIEGGRIK
tara:strand:- start:177 stop:1205 length:1029 start_codon:yes stop_codon:yes gene_type:complete